MRHVYEKGVRYGDPWDDVPRIPYSALVAIGNPQASALVEVSLDRWLIDTRPSPQQAALVASLHRHHVLQREQRSLHLPSRNHGLTKDALRELKPSRLRWTKNEVVIGSGDIADTGACDASKWCELSIPGQIIDQVSRRILRTRLPFSWAGVTSEDGGSMSKKSATLS